MNVIDLKMWGLIPVLAILLSAGCGGEGTTTSVARCISSADCENNETCSRGTCTAVCSVNADCPGSENCVDGACIPAVGSQDCISSADCTSPPNPCQVAAGAICSRGVCSYPDKQCVTPPPDECIDDDTRFVSFLTPGTCTANGGTGICQYVRTEGRDCENCTATCLQECASEDCAPTNSGCRINGIPTLTDTGCICDYQDLDDVSCDDDVNPCTVGLCADGECLVEELDGGESCLDPNNQPIDGCFCIGGAPADCVVDDDCNTDDDACTFSACEDGACVEDNAAVDGVDCDYPDGVVGGVQPVGQCLAGACVECIPGISDARCSDGNSCTDDACVANFCETSPRPHQSACALPSDAGGSQSGLCTSDAVPACVQCLTELSQPDVFGNLLNAKCDGMALPPGLHPRAQACEKNTCTNNQCTTVEAAETTTCNGFEMGATCTNGWCIACTEPSGNDEAECTTTTAVPDGERGAVCVDSFDNENGDPCTGQAGGNCYQGNCFNCERFDNDDDCTNWVHDQDGALTQAGRCTDLGRESGPCSDGNLCTTSDRCRSGGVCSGNQRSCSGQCETGQCDLNDGSCFPKPNGTSCSTATCLNNQTCNGGSCSGGADSCPGPSTCSPSGGGQCVCTPSATCGVFCCESGQQCCVSGSPVSMPSNSGVCVNPGQSCGF